MIMGGFNPPGPGEIMAPSRLDRCERTFWLDFIRAPVVDAVEEEGIEMRRYGPVWTVSVAEMPQAPFLSLVLGGAGRRAVEDGHLAEALDWIESLGVEFRVPITPQREESVEAEDLLNRRGYRQADRLVRFVRGSQPSDFAAPPGVEVVEVREFTEGFGDPLAEAHDLDVVAGNFFDNLPRRERWHCYVALDPAGWPIASASMLSHGEIRQLGFAATAESARGQGAHLALLRRRIEDAAACRGCRLLFAETEEPLDDPDGPSPAARNLVRAGFRQAAVRQVWRR